MNKKVLLSSLLVSGIVATSLLTGNVKAATNVPEYGEKLMSAVSKVSQTEATEDEFILGVLLSNSNKLGDMSNAMTRGRLEDLLNEKYKTDIVKKVYESDGTTEVEKNADYVGTGYIVELSTGRKMKIILYGDVNKDGIVDTDDTVAIAMHNVGKLVLDDDQKLAAHLTVKDAGSEEIDTDDTVRVAYYNVNKAGSEKAGEAILDMALYPEDYMETDETVVSDDVLQSAIDTLLDKESNKTLFDINLDGDNNVAEFGFLDSKKAIAEFVDTGLIDTLVDQLNNNDNLTKIELSVEGLEEPIVLDKNTDTATCLIAANDLIGAILKDKSYTAEQLLTAKVEELFGAELKAKFYVTDTSVIDDDDVENEKVMGGTYVEYTLKFVGKLNVDNSVKEMLDDVISKPEESGNLFTTTFDPETNVSEVGILNNESKIKDLASEELINAIAEKLTDTNIKKVEFSILKNESASIYEREVVEYNENIDTNKANVKSAIESLLNSALGIDNALENETSILELAGKTLKTKIYVDENTTLFDDDAKIEGSDRYIEYSIKFIADVTGQIESEFNELNNHAGNDIYRVEFAEGDNHSINFNIANASRDTKLSEIKGTGTTGLIEMATKILSSDPDGNIQNITVSFNGQDYEIRKIVEDVATNDIEAATNLFNAIFGITEESETNVMEEKLSKLENVELEIKIGLSEKAVAESNWNSEETFKVKFNFVETLA